MLKAVLFDLDNTLIRFSERVFFESYISRVPQAFADIMPADMFVERLLLSTQALMNNNGEMPNIEYFMNVFSEGYEERKDELWSRFAAFYETEYDRFKDLMSASQGGREVILRLKEKGAKIVIASNPIWPLNLQLKRLSWAGLGDISFDLSCLMVGNDPVNDMVVAAIGMKTYLVTEGATDESALELSRSVCVDTPGGISKPDYEGPLSLVPDAVEALLRDDEGS